MPDSVADSEHARNAVTLTFDLSGFEHGRLSLAALEYGDDPMRIRISSNNDRPFRAVSVHGKEEGMERDTGFEPATSSLGSWHSAKVNLVNKQLTEEPNVATPISCPSDTILKLAQAILKLSPGDRTQLIVALLGEQPERHPSSG